MGFSVEEARVALASTDTGLDVQAALETLLSNGAASEVPNSHAQRVEEHGFPRRPESSARPKREPSRRDAPSPSQYDKATQADKILAQASEIGITMFSRANAFWSQSKEALQKAYEERAKPTASRHPSRPRWMQDDVPPSTPDAELSSRKREGGYSDQMSPTEPQHVTISKVDSQRQNHKPPPKEELILTGTSGICPSFSP